MKCALWGSAVQRGKRSEPRRAAERLMPLVLGRQLRKGGRTDFANHVFQHGTAEHFSHFQDLHALVNRILGSLCQPDSPATRER